jgi:hypothetical protein
MEQELHIDYLKIENYFTDQELTEIWHELDQLNRPGILDLPEDTGASIEGDGIIRKANSGLFFHDVYKHPKYSPVMTHVRKMFNGSTSKYAGMSLWNMGILQTTASSTLLSYYENSDHYKPHTDAAVVTVLHWLWKEPKRFEGGELTLLDTGEKIPLTNNTMLMFPSHCWHEVSPIVMEEQYRNQGLGRYCITTFLYTTANPSAEFEAFMKANANR